MKKIVPNLQNVAPDARFMFVTTPVDVVTYVALKLTGLPRNQVFGSGTVLATSRLRYLVSRETGVATQNIHAYVAGEHGDSEFPVWSAANIGMVPLTEWEQDGKPVFTEEVRAELATEAMRAAYKVIEGKGSTNYAIGISGARIAEAFLGGQNAVLPVSTTIAGELYGFKDVALSLPTIVNREGIQRVLEVPMNEAELAQLKASAEAIRASAASLGF